MRLFGTGKKIREYFLILTLKAKKTIICAGTPKRNIIHMFIFKKER